MMTNKPSQEDMENMIDDFNEFLEYYLEIVRIYYNLDNISNDL